MTTSPITDFEVITAKTHFAMQGKSDWKKKGASMYHLIAPHANSSDVTGFENGLKESVPDKLQEAANRSQKLRDEYKWCLKYIAVAKLSEAERLIVAAELVGILEELAYIAKWERNWLNLARKLQTTIPKKVKQNLDRFSEEEIEKARQYPLTELYSSTLRHIGSHSTGLCPFHEEKTPSFVIYEDENTYHCFGCGAHGNAIDFVIALENFSFPETVRRLL